MNRSRRVTDSGHGESSPYPAEREGYEEKAAEANAALEGGWRRKLEDYGKS